MKRFLRISTRRSPLGLPLSLSIALLSSALLPSCDGGGDSSDPEPDAMLSGGAGGGSGCAPGSVSCLDESTALLCDADGVGAESACEAGTTCVDGEGCVPEGACVGGETVCDGPTLLRCRPDGGGFDSEPCPEGCVEDEEGARCAEGVCAPGERRCQGAQIVTECRADGTGFEVVERCNTDRTARECNSGECVPLCELSEKVKTNVGCDYWAADLDNALVPGGERGFLNAADSQYSIVVSNPHPEFTGEVSVYNNEALVETAVLPPLGLYVFNLPKRNVDGTVLAPLAYRVRSSIPIVAYQFNPLENVDVFSNDASLLLPSHVLGDRYYVMTREQSFAQLRGFLTVIGISEEPTVVDVTVTAPTRPGLGGIPALAAGETTQVVLNQFDVLSLETNAPGADLTGSIVTASQDVVVFGGSEAANAPNTNHCVDIDPETGEGVCEAKPDEICQDNYDCNDARLNTCCADHLEQQLFPIDTWGRHYVAAKSYDRGLELDQWRILAAEDDTKVETVPAVVDIPTLNAGEWYEFGSRADFEIISDKPVMVGQFLASQDAPNPNLREQIEPGDAGTGDPAFILSVPVEQFRQDFVFLAPDKYAFDYVTVVAPVEAQVFFDEDPVPGEWTVIGDASAWKVARFPIADGVHFIQSDEPCAITVYGYDQYVSYGYPGGLNLDVVDPETGMAQP